MVTPRVSPDKTRALDPQELRRLRLFRRKRRNREKREKLSRDEMIAYLRSHKFKSELQLRNGRQRGEPNDYDYAKEFGSWKKAKEAAFGKVIEPPAIDSVYLIKTVTDFGLWTYRKYLAAHKRSPGTVPAWYQVKKFFGRWGNLRAEAEKVDFRKCLEEYGKLFRRYGRRPTMEEIERSTVQMGKILSFFNGKKMLDEFVQRLEAQREK